MEFLTRQEIAQRLKIGVRTVDRRIADGQLECHRLGDGPRAPVRISEEQLQRYLNRSASHISEEDRHAAAMIIGGHA